MHSGPARAIGRCALATGLVRTALLIALLGLGGCERPGFRLTVTFPGPLDLEVGSLVRYEGVAVGGITEVTLQQASPSEPGQVEVGVVIDRNDVVLREGDVFEVASGGLLEDSYLRITPAPGTSPPLASGARVSGTPPLAARVVETTEQALARLGVLAREQADRLVESLAEQFDDRSLRPDDLPAADGTAAPDLPDDPHATAGDAPR